MHNMQIFLIKAINNEAKYEAIIIGLRLIIELEDKIINFLVIPS